MQHMPVWTGGDVLRSWSMTTSLQADTLLEKASYVLKLSAQQNGATGRRVLGQAAALLTMRLVTDPCRCLMRGGQASRR